MENESVKPFRIVGLPGDCIGPEVYASACRVLDVLAGVHGFHYELDEQQIGGAAVDATGKPLPQATIDACKKADAALLGAVGGPKWDKLPAEQRPELGLLQIRAAFNLFCNLRPIVTHPALHGFAPLKPELLTGVDLMIVRELTSGLYFGKKWRDAEQAEDVCRYTREEIERVTRAAAVIACQRERRITLVDKANVLETSRLWREVVHRVIGEEFPDVSVENLFGYILSDEASTLCGSLGLLPSASLNDERFGLYEPVHGSAPDIAGKGIANPYAMMLSVAMMLRHSLDLPDAASALEETIHGCWNDGLLTRDLTPDGLGTDEITDEVCKRLV